MTLNFIRNQRFPDQSTSTTNLAILKLPFPALRQQTYKLFWSASLHFSCADIANVSKFHGNITSFLCITSFASMVPSELVSKYLQNVGPILSFGREIARLSPRLRVQPLRESICFFYKYPGVLDADTTVTRRQISQTSTIMIVKSVDGWR